MSNRNSDFLRFVFELPIFSSIHLFLSSTIYLSIYRFQLNHNNNILSSGGVPFVDPKLDLTKYRLSILNHLCLSVYLSIYVSNSPSACPSNHASIYLFTSLSFSLFLYQCFHLPLLLASYLSVHPLPYTSDTLPVFQFVHEFNNFISFFLSIHPSILIQCNQLLSLSLSLSVSLSLSLSLCLSLSSLSLVLPLSM